MSWIIFATFSLVLSVSYNLGLRVLAVRSENDRAFSFAFNLCGSILAIIFFLLTQPISLAKFNLSAYQLFIIGLGAIFYGFYERFQMYARKNIDASAMTILLRLSPLIAFLMSVLILGESITINKIIGLTTILLASILLVYKNTAFKINKAFFIAILCAVMLGLAWTVDKKASGIIDVATITVLMWTAPLAIIGFPFISLQSIKKEFKIGSWKIWLLGLINVALYYCDLRALQLADATLVIPFISTSTIFTVILGILLLKENGNPKRTLLAGILATIGIIFLA